MIVALIVTGFDEFMWLLRNPITLLFLVAFGLFLRAMYQNLDVETAMAMGVVPGLMFLGTKAGVAALCALSRTTFLTIRRSSGVYTFIRRVSIRCLPTLRYHSHSSMPLTHTRRRRFPTLVARVVKAHMTVYARAWYRQGLLDDGVGKLKKDNECRRRRCSQQAFKGARLKIGKRSIPSKFCFKYAGVQIQLAPLRDGCANRRHDLEATRRRGK